MSDASDLRIEPTPVVASPAPVQAVRQQTPAAVGSEDRKPASEDPKPASVATTPTATTGGSLRPAYAQFNVNPDTHDIVIRIYDATTDQVISETPSREFEAMSKYLADYATTMGRYRGTVTNSIS